MALFKLDGFIFTDKFDPEFPGYKKKGYSKEYVPLHNYVYWKETKTIPEHGRTAIHHIDGNRENNSFENLELITTKEHNKIHSQKKERRLQISKTLTNDKSFPGAYYNRGLKTKPWNKVWVARIVYNGNQMFLGQYNDPLSASIIYEFVRKEIYVSTVR